MPQETGKPRQLGRSELITLFAHYYRGEVQRSLAWRERLDRTTNWAVGTTAAFLGFGFSHPEIPHTIYFFGTAVVYTLLFVESRRFRFYDAYEYRVRLMHQNLVYGALTGTLDISSTNNWVAELASDLRHPKYKIDMRHALGRRLRANYIFLFSILLCGWLFKIAIHPEPLTHWSQIFLRTGWHFIPNWLLPLLVLLFLVHLLILMRFGHRLRGGRDTLFND